MVLAYSGGLDTSVILKWLQETYECEVGAGAGCWRLLLGLPLGLPNELPAGASMLGVLWQRRAAGMLRTQELECTDASTRDDDGALLSHTLLPSPPSPPPNTQVVTFTADLGQGEELEPARKKAEAAGVKEIYIDDLREEFVRDFVFPMFRRVTRFALVWGGELLWEAAS